jgi:hypothetical protein
VFCIIEMSGTNVRQDPIVPVREKNKKILGFYAQERIKHDDVLELIHGGQKVDAILGHILSTKYYNEIDDSSLSFKIFIRSLEKLDTILNEYKNTLSGLERSNQLDKFLNNANIRRNIEQLNSALLIEAVILEEKHTYLAKEAEGKKGGTTNKVVQQEEKKIIIEDPAGQSMWDQFIGAKVLILLFC